MRKKFIFLVSIICFIVLISSFSFFYFTKRGIFAASSDNTIGWAWSENIGWISLNVFNDYNNDGKLDDHGSSSWNKTYNSGANDQARSVAIDSSENIFITGYKWNGSNLDYLTIKYDSTGATSTSFGTNGIQTYDSGGSDSGQDITIDSNNNVIVTGTASANIYTVKYDNNGAWLWDATYNSGSLDYGMAVTTDFSNNVIVVGYILNASGNYDYIIIKYKSNGSLDTSFGNNGIIIYDISGGNDHAAEVAVDSNNNILVTGYVKNGSANDYYTIKYAPDSTGSSLWEQRYHNDSNYTHYARGVDTDSNNNIFVAGYGYNGLNFDVRVIKYDANGAFDPVWGNGGKIYDSSQRDWAMDVVADHDDNIIVTGHTIGTGFDYLTIKFNNTSGEITWKETYNGSNTDTAYGVAVDSLNNIVVTGYNNVGPNDNFYTIKYNIANAGYGVGINIVYPTGEVQGYAWSENIGWIHFNPDVPYPDSPYNSVHYDFNTKELSGWAKIINSGDNGWIKFQGPVESAPVQYNLCRGCVGVQPDKICDFCYETIKTDAFGKQYGADRVGTQCSVCSDDDATCRICSNNYRYGVSVISYDLGSDGVRKILEGWAYNDATIGWIHFNYAYANYNAPSAFDNFSASLTTVPPVNTCKSVDLSWESSFWASSYEIWKDNGSLTSQDCSTAIYSFSSGSDVSICSDGSCAAQDSTLNENTYYCFKIKAVNSYGSTFCTNNTPTHPCPTRVKTPLCAPDSFTADGKTCGEINLSWTDKTEELNYKIYRNLTDISATSSTALIVTLPADTITYSDKNVIPGQTYYYLLTAISGSGDESPVAQAIGKTQCYKGPKFEEK